MNFPSKIFSNDINHCYRAAILKKNSLWLLPFYIAVATYWYYEKLRRTMRNAIVSYLLKPFISRCSIAVSNIDTKDQAPELLLVTDAVDLVLYLDLWSMKRYSFIFIVISNDSHKKWKDSLETQAVFSWILILTGNFGGGWRDSASTFFETASAGWFWCC